MGNDYKIGEALKRQAMMLMNLSPDEEALFNQQSVRAVPQKWIRKNYPEFEHETPGLTSYRPNGRIDVNISENLPYAPKLTLRNFQHLDPFITEKDVIAHEMGHVKDFRERGETSEESAIGFQDELINRDFGSKPATLGEALMRASVTSGNLLNVGRGSLGKNLIRKKNVYDKQESKMFYHTNNKIPRDYQNGHS